MKDFVGVSTSDGKIKWVVKHGRAVMDYLKKYPDQFFRVWFEPVNQKFKKKSPKTAAQLGFYHALLLPEIHRELIRQGHTTTIKFGTIEKEIDISKEDAHEAITALSGNINGKHLRLRDCGFEDCMKWLDNVMDLVAQLNMDLDELKKLRPKK